MSHARSARAANAKPKVGDRVRYIPYGEVYGTVNKVTRAGWVHVTLEGRFPVLARWPIRQIEVRNP